jgi:hypothetical protein
MKSLTIIATFLFSAAAFANPFDGFIGEYKVNGSPQITNNNAKWCNRFDFKNITGLKVEKDTSGYQQSHVIYIQKPNGWSGHPTMDFSYTNDLKNGGSYAKTSGSNALASNEYGTWGLNPIQNETLTVSIEKSAAGYTFNMAEVLYENSVLTAACYYRAQLTKK